jgi:hypothetical protein
MCVDKTLLDHLVGAGEHGRWNFEAQRPGSLEIDDRRKLGGLLTGISLGLVPLRILSTKAAARRNIAAKFTPYPSTRRWPAIPAAQWKESGAVRRER